MSPDELMTILESLGLHLTTRKGWVAVKWPDGRLSREFGSARLGKLMLGKRPRMLFTFVGTAQGRARDERRRIRRLLETHRFTVVEEQSTSGSGSAGRVYIGAPILDVQTKAQWTGMLDAVMASVSP